MSDMRDVILNQPEQITHSMGVNAKVRIEGTFDSMVLCGMGGSGHPGDLLNALRLPSVPLTVHRSYDLPPIYGNKPLIITSSYSGNTEEALTSYRMAQHEGYTMLGSASGGTLEEWAKRDGVPFAKIDFPGMQPRHTLFAACVGIIMALKNSGLAEDPSEDLKRVAQVLADSIPELEAPGRLLAQNLKGKIPIFTSSNILEFAAKNFKIQLNENSKTPAFWNYFPELNHNELVGFSNLQKNHMPGQFHVVVLRDDDDHVRTKARMDVTKELYEEWNVGVSEFEVKGTTLLEKIFYAVSFGLWTSYYLAREYGVDPVPVEGVENFKQRLKEVAGDAA